MAALKEVARNVAEEIRDGIGWVIVYKVGRSWHSLTLWSDVASDEWETEDLNDALGILKVDAGAVLLNGYYCGHFAEDMSADEIAAGIRWHYENGYNLLANDCTIQQAQESIEEARAEAEAAGLPFSEKLADGADDEPDPYIYDGSMTVADFGAMQAAQTGREQLAAVVTNGLPGITDEKLDQIVAAASALHISPETMQRILGAFDRVFAAVKEVIAAMLEALRPVMEWATKSLNALWEALARPLVPPRWWHLYKHSKKARIRKKYRKRISEAVLAALAPAGGDTS